MSLPGTAPPAEQNETHRAPRPFILRLLETDLTGKEEEEKNDRTSAERELPTSV